MMYSRDAMEDLIDLFSVFGLAGFELINLHCLILV